MLMLAPVVEKVGLQLLLEPQTSGAVFKGACSVAGVLYPAWQTFKAIENKKSTSQDTKWLTYWGIYATLTLAEGLVQESLAKIPYYYHARFCFLVWLQLPSTEGARQLYTRLVRPYLNRYQQKVDICIDKLGVVVGELYKLYKGPIDQVTALGVACYLQGYSFISWFLSAERQPLSPMVGPVPPVVEQGLGDEKKTEQKAR